MGSEFHLFLGICGSCIENARAVGGYLNKIASTHSYPPADQRVDLLVLVKRQSRFRIADAVNIAVQDHGCSGGGRWQRVVPANTNRSGVGP